MLAKANGRGRVGVPLMRLKNNMCRWPMWGNGEPVGEAMFCGKPVAGGCSFWYCGEHMVRAVNHRETIKWPGKHPSR